ncbi:uncharacterized protein LOC126903555 isoform X2 [Daktulosphaira vitifoliae]|uniref:uncharacterized protein LOC126903555 isoform X2 n=1 Tax=Daktulosphaira vitifoliae TaxID=58002 RepID=UPI0021AAEA2E|nr:uncharacterized protein LOC126903555 isoform X2 [Daktulosphaira vitifoliae]
MEPLESLNLRTDECSFLESVISDVRRYVDNYIPEKKEIVLVFPPLNPRKRFLVHSLIQNYFKDLKTLSIGNSFGRRNVVYHSSLSSMINNEKMESLEEYSDNCSTNTMEKLYKTPRERKAQDKLFKSLKPDNIKSSTRSSQRKINKRPDIPIYVPKQRRESSNNSFNNIESESSACMFQNVIKVYQKEICTSKMQLSRNYEFSSSPSCQENSSNLDLVSKSLQSSCKLLGQIPESFKACTCCSTNIDSNQSLPLSPDGELISTKEFCNEKDCTQIVNECNLDNLVENNANNVKVSKLDEKTNNEIDDSCSIVSQNILESINLKDNNLALNNFQEENEYSNLSSKLIVDEISNNLESKSIEIKDNVRKFDLESNCDNTTILTMEHESLCPSFSLDDSFNSELMLDINDDTLNSPKKYSSKIADDQILEKVNKDSIIEENCLEAKTDEKKIKKKKKKKVLDVEECSWEDLFDKEDEYIHPLLMKELVTTMGNVQVKRAEEDYRSYQTVEERTGDGECVIEVYGFSSQLKTVDLMNQFSAFRKKHFDIVWVDDTHALAVFESPNFGHLKMLLKNQNSKLKLLLLFQLLDLKLVLQWLGGWLVVH